MRERERESYRVVFYSLGDFSFVKNLILRYFKSYFSMNAISNVSL